MVNTQEVVLPLVEICNEKTIFRIFLLYVNTYHRINR